jgi:hypothetical protein
MATGTRDLLERTDCAKTALVAFRAGAGGVVSGRRLADGQDGWAPDAGVVIAR